MEQINYTTDGRKSLDKSQKNIVNILDSYFTADFKEAEKETQELIGNLGTLPGYEIYGPHLELLEACLASEEISEREFFVRVYELGELLGADVPDDAKGNYVHRKRVEEYPGYGDTSVTMKRRTSDWTKNFKNKYSY